MEAIKIFTHSVKQVFGNLGAALKLTIVPSVLAVAALFVMGALMANAQLSSNGAPTAAIFGGILCIVFVAVSFLAAAVNWHRFVLQNEAPTLIPRLHGKAILNYLGRAIIIALLSLLALIPVMLVFQLIMPALMGGGSMVLFLIFSMILNIFLAALSLRLSVTLPSMAIGEPTSIGEGWNSTAGKWGTMMLLSAIIIVFQMIISIVVQFAILPSLTSAAVSVILAVLGIAAYWFMAMLGLSILTTLYGHYVQGRALR